MEKKFERQKMQEAEEPKTLVRIFEKDIPGEMRVLAGLTKVYGISWSFSNALCKALKIDKDKRVSELSQEEIKRIENFEREVKIPSFLLNRQKDYDDGKDKHIIGSDLRLRKEFDIKRLKKIKCYRGVRHNMGLPVRGQRTRSHFRKNRKKTGAVGVKKKK